MVELAQFVFPDLEVCQRCEGTGRVERPRAGVVNASKKKGFVDDGIFGWTVVKRCPYEGPDHVTYPPDQRFTLHRTDALGYTVAVKTWDPWPGRIERG